MNAIEPLYDIVVSTVSSDEHISVASVSENDDGINNDFNTGSSSSAPSDSRISFSVSNNILNV